jgi:hypothetical protein
VSKSLRRQRSARESWLSEPDPRALFLYRINSDCNNYFSPAESRPQSGSGVPPLFGRFQRRDAAAQRRDAAATLAMSMRTGLTARPYSANPAQMRTALFLLLLASAAFGQTSPLPPAPAKDPDAIAATSAKSYDLGDLDRVGITLDGQVVKIKFSARSGLTKNSDGSVSGTLVNTSAKVISSFENFQGNRQYEKKEGSVSVTTPAEHADWFVKLPSTGANTQRTQVVFGKIVVKGSSFHVVILGRELTTDLHGPHFVW